MPKKAWHTKPCSNCGQDHLASRGEPIEEDAPSLCEGCQMWQRGYTDGVMHSQKLLRDCIKNDIVHDRILDVLLQEPKELIQQ